MRTQQMVCTSSYNPFLRIVDEEHLSADDCGRRIEYGDVYIKCCNDSYEVRSNANDDIVDRISISQDADGVDTENRVDVLRRYVANMK